MKADQPWHVVRRTTGQLVGDLRVSGPFIDPFICVLMRDRVPVSVSCIKFDLLNEKATYAVDMDALLN